jgi:GntR family transcriptional regulator, trigonelline degradation regulator
MRDASLRVETVAAPVRQKVVEVLRAAITAGRFAPGERLTERSLCELTGVSRASVREALRQLESEGLIETLPNRGPLVSRLSRRDAVSLYQMRGALEALAARLFAGSATDGQIDELAAAVSVLQRAYASRDIEEIVRAKRRFYDVLFEGSGNSMIGPTLNAMYARVNQLRRVSLSSPKRGPQSMREIRALLAAIRRRDPDAAYAASLHHVEQAAKAALANLRA